LTPRAEVGNISSTLLSWTAFINFLPYLEDFITCGRVEERVLEKNLVSSEVLLISGDISYSW
jgi:hypothetical protein